MENKEVVDLSVLEGVDGLPTSSLMTFNGKVATDVPTPEVLTFSQEMQNKFSTGPQSYLPFEMTHQSSAESLASQMFGDKLTEVRGNIDVGRDYIQLKSGKYIPKYEQFMPGVDNNERMAQLQNTGALEDGIWSRGWDRFWGTAGTTFIGGLAGLPYGVASAINEGSITAFYDNDLTSWLDDVAEKAKYNGNQIYYSQAEQDMSILEGAGTKKFWADKVLGGASFTIGTIGSELLWSIPFGGTNFAGRIAQRGLQKGLQASDDIMKAGSKISSATNKFNKAMKKAVTDADAIASTTARATQKGINAGKVAEGINTARFVLTSSAYEAGFEARHMKDESEKAFIDYYQNNMGRMPNQEEWNKFQDELEDSSRNVAIANMALLSVSNLAMFGKMFNVKVPFASGRSVSEGNALTRRMFGYGVKTAEDGTKTVAKSNFLQKGLRTAWGLGKSGATEGIFEEGGQGIASTWMKNYMESTYDPEAVATTLKESASFISPYLKEAVSDQFGTKEGIEEMFIGSIIGSLFGGFGTISGQRQDRKNLEKSVDFDNNSQQMREGFINNIYTKESILAKIGGTARSFASQAEQQEAIEKGMPVRAQLKAQESLISMLDTAYSVGKDGGFVDALVADMQSMDVSKIMNEYGMSKQEAQTFIAENIVAVEKLAKDYSKSRELAETIATQAPSNLDKEKIVRGLTLALTTRGNVAEIVKDASIKLKTLLEQNGSSKRGLIAELGTLQSLISGDANKEFEDLTQERLKLEDEHTKLTKELQDAQTGEDVETRTNRVKVINERLIEVDQALSNNNKQGEEMLKSLATPIFGEMGVDFTYNSLIELFKEGSQDIEQIIEKEKINNPSMYFQMRDAFDAINEGAEIFRSFDDVLADFSSKDFSFKSTSPLTKLFKKDSSSNEKVQKVIEDLGNLSLNVSDAPTTGVVNDEVSEREKELESELERREAEEIVSNDVLSEVESENISAPIEEEVEITKEVEEERGKEIIEDVVEDSTPSETGLKPVSSMTTAEIKQELEEIQKEKVVSEENPIQENVAQNQQKYYEKFVKRLGERFNVNIKWSDGGHPSQPNARGWYDVNTNTAYINSRNFDGSTAIHEIFGHPFLNKIKTEKPELYTNLLKEATSNAEAVKYVDGYYNAYPEAKNDEAILYVLDSVVRGELSKVNPNKTLLQSINQLIKELKDFVKDLLGVESIDALPNDMNISDLAQMAFYGKNKLDLAPPTFEGKQESLFQVEGYHGSPHSFNEFSTKHIGSGEGAQAFGWGLYFTELESIARGYAETLSSYKIKGEDIEDMDVFNVIISQLDLSNKDFYNSNTGKITNIELFEKYLKERLTEEESKSFDLNSPEVKEYVREKYYSEDRYNESLNTLKAPKSLPEDKVTELLSLGVDEKFIENLQTDIVRNRKNAEDYIKGYIKFKAGESLEKDKALSVIKNMTKSRINYYKHLLTLLEDASLKRYLYSVSINKGRDSSEYDFIIWDKPLTEKQKKSILESEIILKRLDDFFDYSDKTHFENLDEFIDGRDFYTTLSKKGLNPKELSLALAEIGIDGIKYPAESISRGATSDNAKGFNYVIFDESAITLENKIQFQLSPEQREARIKELQDELARRKAKLEKVHEKYDNMYLKFVEEGKLTREQAIREMEKYNRTDSNAYRALIQGIEDVVLEEQKVNELLIVENLIQEDAEYLKNVFNIDVNNIVKPTEEDFNRRLELSSKSSLNKAEKEEYDKLGDKILAFNIARGTMVKEDISLMDLINLKTQLAKAKHMALNEARTLPIKDVVENDLESLKAQEERLKGQDGVGRQNNITQVTEDVYIQYNQRNSNHQITKDTGISHMSLSDIMERVVSNNPDAIITTPEGEEVYSDFEKYNGLANISLFVTVDGMLTEFHIPRNTSHDRDGAKSGRPVTMVFNEQFGTPEAQLKKLTGIDTYTDSTVRSNYVLAIENDAPILKSKEFEPKGSGIIFDPQASARVQAGDELEVVMTLEDDFNRQLHNTTAKEEMINAREKQKATVKNLEAQLENEKKFIKDEFIAEDVENKLKGVKKTKENLELALRIFGIPKDVQKEYNKAKESFNKFKEKGKNAKGRADMRADINGGALNSKRFTLITETGKRGRLNDGLAIKGQFYDKVDKTYLTTAQADKVMFDLEVAKREKSLKEPNYGEIVFNRIQKGELNVKEAILKKGNAKNYLSLSSQGRALLKIEEKIKEATTKLNRLTDSINDTAIIANDSIEFQRNANAWIVLPGTKIAVGRLKASYEKVDASEKSRGLIGVRSLLSSQLSADNIEARVKVKADFVFIGTPIHNYVDGVATPQNVSERDVVGHGYIENGTIVANGNIDFEDVFVKNISKKNVDVQIPFAVFEDKVSGRHVAYPVTLGNKTGAEAHDKVIEILDSSLPKGKKLSEINEVLINSQIPPIGDISVLDNQAGIQAMLDQILEQSIPVSVEEFLNKFPQEEGVVQTTLNFKGKAFATPKHVLDLNNVPEAEAHLASLKLQGINYFKEETTKKAKKEATKDCNNGM